MAIRCGVPTFQCGAREIGGNRVELEHDGHSILHRPDRHHFTRSAGLSGEKAARLLDAGRLFLPRQPVRHNLRTYSDRQPVSLGPFTITPFLVDHSAFDACAFLIEAGGRRVCGRAPPGGDVLMKTLRVWAATIGVRSSLFHTFANRWCELAAIVPIWSFVTADMAYTLRPTWQTAPALRWGSISSGTCSTRLWSACFWK